MVTVQIKTLDRKLLRDLWRLKGQALSIGLVIASGIALLVMALSTHEALRVSTDAYYDRYRFGHVFAAVKRAPLHLEDRIRALRGVQSVQLRISVQAILDVEGFPEPLMGRLVSVPEGQQPALNQLRLRRGRLVAEDQPDEVVINESFAVAHGLKPGDTIRAIINDKERPLRIVGTAHSPEFIYVISPFALMPDKKRYGILWMGRKALEAAYDFEGAFNDVSLTVLRGTDTRPTVDALDSILAPFGGYGAVDRSNHLSSWFIDNEIKQNQATAKILPTIFLLVAAFLTNSVLTRLVFTERSEIGLMKAFGYDNYEVGWHYAKLVIAITLIGILMGWVLGAMLGHISTVSYARNLNLPLLIYRPSANSFVIGALASLAIALMATIRAVVNAATLPPIVAMTPPQPPVFTGNRGVMKRLLQALDESTRIIVRQIIRWPMRALVTVAGFSGAIAMVVLALYFSDAVETIAHTHFDETQREDIALGFQELHAAPMLNDITRLPGVQAAEPMHLVSADFQRGNRTHRGTLQGISRGAQFSRIYDVRRGPIEVPESGIVLTSHLAEKLNAKVGDVIELRILEGRRPVVKVHVNDVYETYIGMSAFVAINQLNQWMGVRSVAEYVSLLVDESQLGPLLGELKNLPAVSTVTLKSVARENFDQAIADTLMIFIGFFTLFAFALGFGVTYNTQRIALSERGRELATLRVLGFSNRDVLYILLGETMLLVLIALPLGCLLGWAMTAIFINTAGFQTELMRLPLMIHPSTYGYAILVLLVASVVSGLVMQRWINRLDLVAVLKTRE